jgi:hypothetical protein
MDYLFYGEVIATSGTDTTTISLKISCEPDEIIRLYEFSSDMTHHLVYKQLPVERLADGVSAVFEVQNDQLFLLVISGQSNEIDIPFEATYAVYHGEVIALPENNVLRLTGSTYVSLDGKRKTIN